MPALLTKSILVGAASILVAASGFLTWRLVHADVESRVYRQRLVQLANDYRHLRDRYNDAVRRTVVNELVVHDGALYVRVRNAAGTISLIETPADPAKEIFADFVVVDGRLWIRRVYDQSTPPEFGFTIDDKLGPIPWDDDPKAVGKVVYRPLSEGRWAVSVSGDGSLGLARIGDVPPEGLDALRADVPPELTRLPPIGEFEEWLDDTAADRDRITFSDVIDALVGSDSSRRKSPTLE